MAYRLAFRKRVLQEINSDEGPAGFTRQRSRFELHSIPRPEKVQTISSSSGKIGVVEFGRQVPFMIKRVYYIYAVPSGCDRGAHAHIRLEQFLVVLSGSVDVVLDDGDETVSYHMNSSSEGIYIGPGTWRDLKNFSGDAICLVLASELYEESDYIRDYNQFKESRWQR